MHRLADVPLGDLGVDVARGRRWSGPDPIDHEARDGGCEVHPVCPIRSPIERIREHIWRLFETTSLRSLAPVRHASRDLVVQRLRESLAAGTKL